MKCGDKDEQFVLGSPPSHEAIGERNHGSFEAYGGVEVLDQIIYEIAEAFCVYSPGRYALTCQCPEQFHLGTQAC